MKKKSQRDADRQWMRDNLWRYIDTDEKRRKEITMIRKIKAGI